MPAFLFILIFQHSFEEPVPQYSGLEFHELVIFAIMILFCCFILGLPLLIPVTLLLGIVILVRGDNLSLSLLVIGNIFPCILLRPTSLSVLSSSESQRDHE